MILCGLYVDPDELKLMNVYSCGIQVYLGDVRWDVSGSK